MKISMRWLNDYVEIGEFFSRPEALAAQLTSVGIEVEGFEDISKKYAFLKIGHIRTKGTHPDADRLSLCEIDIGDGESRQIVCGASNHKQGDKVVVALPGARLPGDFEIKLSRIRGVESQGMLCSEVELGLAKESAGIMILPETAPLGQSFAEYMDWNDVILDLSVTPNRADCLSHLGLAREIAAILGKSYRLPKVEEQAKGPSISKLITLDVIKSDLCPRYSGRAVFGVKVAPSPQWLSSRLEKLGVKSINNVVDVTNYVMFELGQPLHAFDLSELHKNQIVVDSSVSGEAFKTLDGTDLTLSGEELMIRDGERSLALAGVVGGLNSGVKESTQDIFLESAHFLRESVRKTSRKWGIDTESAYRFSRGTDPDGVLFALNRACFLIQEVAGGDISCDCHDVYPQPPMRKAIAIDKAKIESALGYPVSAQDFESWMSGLGCTVEAKDKESWKVKPPSFRWDLEISSDLIEEFARLEGYEKIPETFPKLTHPPLPHDPSFVLEDRLNSWWASEGYLQSVNHGFLSEQSQAAFIDDSTKLRAIGLETPDQAVKVKNPLSEETNEMRVSLLPGLFKNLVYNLRQGHCFGRLFETGKVFGKEGSSYKEETRTAIVGWGQPKNLWGKDIAQCPVVYSLKESIENLLSRLLISSYQWRSIEADCPLFFHPGQSVGLFLEGRMVGVLGSLHPQWVQDHKLRQPVALAELAFENLMRGQPRLAKAKSFSKFPSVERDLSFLVPSSIEAGDILKELRKQTNHLLDDISIFDVYSDDKLEEGLRSVSYRMSFRDGKGTLEESQIVDLLDRLVGAVKKRFNIAVR